MYWHPYTTARQLSGVSGRCIMLHSDLLQLVKAENTSISDLICKEVRDTITFTTDTSTFFMQSLASRAEACLST